MSSSVKNGAVTVPLRSIVPNGDYIAKSSLISFSAPYPRFTSIPTISSFAISKSHC